MWVRAWQGHAERRGRRGRRSPWRKSSGCPAVPRTAKVVGAALSYRAHAAEGKRSVSETPNLLARFPSTFARTGMRCLCRPVTATSTGRRVGGGHRSPASGRGARGCVQRLFGYTILNDLSAREYQRAASQFGMGKNAYRSAPIGPVIVTTDELADPYWAILETKGEWQVGATGEMVFRRKRRRHTRRGWRR